jgi:hypothetical protein
MSIEAMRKHADRAHDQLHRASHYGQQSSSSKHSRTTPSKQVSSSEQSPLIPPNGATAAPAPLDFVLLTGDFVAHFVPCLNGITETHHQVASLLSSYFPARVLIPMIGNTDLFPDFTVSPLPGFVQTSQRPHAPNPSSVERFPWSPSRRLLEEEQHTDGHQKRPRDHQATTISPSSSSTGGSKPSSAPSSPTEMPSVFATPLTECTPQLARLANQWASFGWLNRSSSVRYSAHSFIHSFISVINISTLC